MKGNLSYENSRMVDAPAPDVYEIRPRRERDGFDLISDRLPDGPIPYAGPDAVRNAAAYAKYYSWSRSRQAIVRVLNHSEALVEDCKALARHTPTFRNSLPRTHNGDIVAIQFNAFAAT